MTLKEFLNLNLIYCSYDTDYDNRPLVMVPKLETLECGLHAMTNWKYSSLCRCNMPKQTEPLYFRDYPEDGYCEEEQEDGSIKLVPTPKPGWYIPDGQYDGQIPFTTEDLLNAEVRTISDNYGDCIHKFGILLDLCVNWETP